MTSSEITSLVRLIDDYLVHEGQFDSYDINIEPGLDMYAARLQSSFSNTPPSSVSTGPVATLHESLARQQEESTTQRERLMRIKAMLQNCSLKQAILASLEHEYHQLDTKYEDGKFRTTTNLIQKVRFLRILQRKAHEASSDTFEVLLLVDAGWNGAPKTEKIWLSGSAGWGDFLTCLRRATCQASFSPSGLDTSNGDWLCRMYNSRGFVDQNSSPVRNQEDYHALRERLLCNGSGVYMVHTRTLEEMTARRHRVDAIKSWKTKVAQRGRQWALKNPSDAELLALEEMLSWEGLDSCPESGYFDVAGKVDDRACW